VELNAITPKGISQWDQKARALRRIGRSVGFCLAFLAIVLLTVFPIKWLLQRLNITDAWLSVLAPVPILVYGLYALAEAATATGLLAWVERRSILSSGFKPSREAFARWGEGAALGVAAAGSVGLLMLVFGGMQIRGLALHGGLWLYGLGWVAAILIAALAEEALTRGYLLVTLARGIGFVPAALATSLLFAWGHMTKPGENATDFVSLALLGLFACFTFRQTGSLWVALGFHWSFDVMQLFIIGTPNGSNKPVGSLLDASFRGPAWINGGQLGVEASLFMFPTLLMLFVYVALRHRTARFSTEPAILTLQSEMPS